MGGRVVTGCRQGWWAVGGVGWVVFDSRDPRTRGRYRETRMQAVPRTGLTGAPRPCQVHACALDPEHRQGEPREHP